MKQQRHKLFLSALMFSAAVSFTACNDDDIDVEILSPVAGNFVGDETCAPAPSSGYTVDIYSQADAGNGKVFIHNLYGIGETYEATVSGKTFTVPSTTYTYKPNATTTYTGKIKASGTVDGSIVKIDFELDGPLADKCVFVGDRNFRNPSEGNGL